MKKSVKIVIVAAVILTISVFLLMYLPLIVYTMHGISHTSQLIDVQMDVTEMKPVYNIGEPITFSVHVKTLGTFVPWPDFRIYKEYADDDDSSQPVHSRNYMTPFEPEDKFNLVIWREQTWDFPLEDDTGNPMVEGDDGTIRFFEEGTYVLRVSVWAKQESLTKFQVIDSSK